MSSEGGGEGGVRRLGQKSGPEGKEAGGRGKGIRDNQKTLTNNMKYARTVSRGLLVVRFKAPVISPLLHRSSAHARRQDRCQQPSTLEPRCQGRYQQHGGELGTSEGGV